LLKAIKIISMRYGKLQLSILKFIIPNLLLKTWKK